MILLQFSFTGAFAETSLNEANNDNTSSNQTVSGSVYSSVYGQGVELQMYNSNTADETNTISPRIKIENKGTKAISLKDLKIRYYYFYDEEKTQNFYCDYSTVGSQNITGSFVKMGNPQTDADNYCEIGFKDAAGSLETGKYVEINTRITKEDWSNYNQTDDYSFDKVDTNYLDNNKVTVSIGDNLIWGADPTGKPYVKQMVQAVKLQMYNGNTTNQINTLFPRFKLINTGNVSINLSDVKIRYYYTIDGNKDQNFWCDYANIGQDKITGKFVKLTDGNSYRGNSDYYFEMGFSGTAGLLKPGKSVDAHIRIAKTDWSNFDQSGDYSFTNVQNDYVDWDKADVYIGDKLVIGTPVLDNSEYNKISDDNDEIYLSPGEKISIYDAITPKYTKKLKLTSNNSSVAAVNDDGIITAVNYGTAIINIETEDGVHAVVYVEVIPAMPVAPTLEIDEINSDSFVISWNKIHNANYYTVKRKVDSGEYIEVGKFVKGTTYTDKDVLPGKNYYYTVLATNKNGTSWDSDELCVSMSMKDSDSDGLTDIEELKYGTNPNLADTDNDGLDDYTEVMESKTNPLLTDTDGDGLTDDYEYSVLKTNPNSVDTDNNGVKDGQEDNDGDKLTNLEEYTANTNPLSKDTDLDGLSDYEEVKLYNTNPNKYDTDNDGLSDSQEISLGFNPNNSDSNNNGVIDSEESVAASIYGSNIAELSGSDNLALPSVAVKLISTEVKTLTMHKDASIRALNENHSVVGYPIDITCSYPIKEATISFKIRDAALTDTKLDNLSIFWYDKATNTVKQMDTKRDYATNTIYTVTPHFSTYFVMNTSKKLQEIGLTPDDVLAKINGQADITFVVDTTSSMDDDIDNVKNNINKFVGNLNKNNVYLRLGIVAYNDYINLPKDESCINYGWFTDVNKFKNTLGNINVGDGGAETPVDALETARRMGFGSNSSKFIVLLTDEGHYDNNRYGVKDMNEEIDLLKKDGITVYVITTEYLSKGNNPQECNDQGYKDLYTKTGGEYANIDQDFSGVLANMSKKIVDKVNDGSWILLSDLSLIKLDKDPTLGDNTVDTDGDGLKDLEELTNKTNLTIGDKVVPCWSFITNPAKADTDGNGITDPNEDLDDDGLSNLQEVQMKTDPLNDDTDGDGLHDGYEHYISNTDSLVKDSQNYAASSDIFDLAPEKDEVIKVIEDNFDNLKESLKENYDSYGLESPDITLSDVGIPYKVYDTTFDFNNGNVLSSNPLKDYFWEVPLINESHEIMGTFKIKKSEDGCGIDEISTDINERYVDFSLGQENIVKAIKDNNIKDVKSIKHFRDFSQGLDIISIQTGSEQYFIPMTKYYDEIRVFNKAELALYIIAKSFYKTTGEVKIAIETKNVCKGVDKTPKSKPTKAKEIKLMGNYYQKYSCWAASVAQVTDYFRKLKNGANNKDAIEKIEGLIVSNMLGDEDLDGLPLDFETAMSVNHSDTDGDGLVDGYEYFVSHTNIYKQDTDNDKVDDGDEFGELMINLLDQAGAWVINSDLHNNINNVLGNIKYKYKGKNGLVDYNGYIDYNEYSKLLDKLFPNKGLYRGRREILNALEWTKKKYLGNKLPANLKLCTERSWFFGYFEEIMPYEDIMKQFDSKIPSPIIVSCDKFRGYKSTDPKGGHTFVITGYEYWTDSSGKKNEYVIIQDNFDGVRHEIPYKTLILWYPYFYAYWNE